MNGITRTVLHWLASAPSPKPARCDVIGDSVRAAVAADANAKVDSSRSYEARVRAMTDELFLRMRDKNANPRS